MTDEVKPPPALEADGPSHRLSFLIKRTRKALDERKYDRAEQDLSDKCNL